MSFEIEGILKVIMDTQTFGSGFTKREFVVTVGDDKYPQDIKMEFVKDNTVLLDKFKTGQRVKIGFNLRGGEHNGRYYVNVQAWRIHPADGSEAPSGGGEARSSGPPRQERTRARRRRAAKIAAADVTPATAAENAAGAGNAAGSVRMTGAAAARNSAAAAGGAAMRRMT